MAIAVIDDLITGLSLCQGNLNTMAVFVKLDLRLLPVLLSMTCCFFSTETNAQIVSTPRNNLTVDDSRDLNKHYSSIGFTLETESKFRNGLSVGYIISPDRKRRYYLGLQLDLVNAKRSRSINVIYQGLTTSNGNLKTRSSATTFSLKQMYFLKSAQSSVPFLSLDVGWRFMQDELETYYYYYSGFPFGWLGNGDNMSLSSSVYSCELGLGYLIKIWDRKGLQLKLGLKNTGGFRTIDDHTIHYDAEGLRYNTYQSVPLFVTFCIGLTL